MNRFNSDLLDHPIQCPEDAPGMTCYDWHMLDNNPNNEPSDDWDYIKHIAQGNQYAPYSRNEIKECQKEVKQRLAAEAAKIKRDVDDMQAICARWKHL